MNVGLTILMVLFIPVMFASVKVYNRLSHSVIRKTREKLSEINVKLAESIDGMKMIQAFNQEERLRKEFEQINEEHVQFSNRSINVNSLFLRPAMSLLKLVRLCGHYFILWPYVGSSRSDSRGDVCLYSILKSVI